MLLLKNPPAAKIPSGGKKAKAKVFIVDDHPLVRQGLTCQINQTGDLAVCGDVMDLAGALEGIKKTKPDLIIADISLKGRSGIELINALRKQRSKIPVLVLSMHDEELYAERVLRAGASGYIMKEEVPDKVLTAIRKILEGEVYLSERISAKILKRIVTHTADNGSPFECLSDRELEVFEFMGQGRSTKQIAERLNLSAKTIESYRLRIMNKLNLQNASDLVRHAVTWIQGRAA